MKRLNIQYQRGKIIYPTSFAGSSSYLTMFQDQDTIFLYHCHSGVCDRVYAAQFSIMIVILAYVIVCTYATVCMSHNLNSLFADKCDKTSFAFSE